MLSKQKLTCQTRIKKKGDTLLLVHLNNFILKNPSQQHPTPNSQVTAAPGGTGLHVGPTDPRPLQCSPLGILSFPRVLRKPHVEKYFTRNML